MIERTDYILARAAAQYRELGLLTTDMHMALHNAGLLIEDVINQIEEQKDHG